MTKTALITGASRGLGAALAEALASYPGVSNVVDNLPYGREQIIFELTPMGQELLVHANFTKQLSNQNKSRSTRRTSIRPARPASPASSRQRCVQSAKTARAADLVDTRPPPVAVRAESVFQRLGIEFLLTVVDTDSSHQ